MGTFRFELPPGIYTVTTHIGFAYDLRRAAFRLRPGETVTLDLAPRLRLLGTTTEVTANGGLKDHEDIAAPTKFEEIDVDPQSPLKALAEFEGRDALRQTVIYRDAVLTYDSVTIYADRIAYDEASKMFEATGDKVIVDTGGTRRIAKRVKVRLRENLRSFEYGADR